MIKIIYNGNIFDSECMVLVNPVNCVGIMGAGLAQQFKNRFPEYFTHYKRLCDERKLRLGKCDYYLRGNNIFCSFPTKFHWRENSKIYNISDALNNLLAYCEENQYSVAIPAVGCGLGSLSWNLVKEQIIRRFGHVDFLAEIYPPLEEHG